MRGQSGHQLPMWPVADRRHVFTLRDLFVSIALLSLLMALVMPLVQKSREEARRDQCASNMTCLWHRLAKYQNARGRFPSLTSQGSDDGAANVWNTAPGATVAPNVPAPNGYQRQPASAAGYSWIAQLLPFDSDTKLGPRLLTASDLFRFEAFSSQGADGHSFFTGKGAAARHFCTEQIAWLRCPSAAGDGICTASSGLADPRIAIPTYRALYRADGNGRRGVATTNYLALAATHLECMQVPPTRATAESPDLRQPNGMIAPGRGLNPEKIMDGANQTLIVCETKEQAVNSWYDETVAWCVGLLPSGPQPEVVDRPSEERSPQAASNRLLVGKSRVALNQTPFAQQGTTRAQTNRVDWGPSSDHAGGVVLHLSAGGSVFWISADVDPQCYANAITPADGGVAKVGTGNPGYPYTY